MMTLRKFASKLKNFGVGAALECYHMEKQQERYALDPFHPTNADVKAAKKMVDQSISICLYLGLQGCSEDEWARVVRSVEQSDYQQADAIFSPEPHRTDADYIYFINGHDRLSDLALYYMSGAIAEQNSKVHDNFGEGEEIRTGIGKNTPVLFYGDEINGDEFYFKPDFAPETFAEGNYIGRNFCIKRSALKELQLDETDYSDEWAAQAVRAVYERYGEQSIYHIKAIMADTKMRLPGEKPVAEIQEESKLEIQEEQKSEIINPSPLVSILIPNKDNIEILDQCLNSILSKSTYPNYEILILENNSEKEDTFRYYQKLESEEANKARVVNIASDWNFSRINNMGAKEAKGQYLLFLNNDTKVQSPDFMEQMLSYAMDENIGAVGAKLFYEDGSIQHAGVTLGIRGVAGHAFLNEMGSADGYMDRLNRTQNVTAVTAACLMVAKKDFDAVGGFDEDLAVAFNDTDFCLKLRKLGLRNVYTPYAKLTHYESKSRGIDEKNEEKLERFNRECRYFQKKWIHELIQGDPYYNPRLSLESDGFEVCSMGYSFW